MKPIGANYLPSLRYKNLIVALTILLGLAVYDTGAAGVGTRFPDERKTFTDEKTGLTVTALTTASGIDNKFYQTHPNWLADGKHIVFVSDRTGEYHLFAIDPGTGEIVQLTEDVPIHHACLERRKNTMIVIRDRDVARIDAGAILRDRAEGTIKPASSYETVAGHFPENYQLLDVPSLDADGQWLYQCAEDTNTGKGCLLKMNLDSGTCGDFLEVPFKPGHVQANPAVPGLLMFCHETGGDAPIRTWIARSGGSGFQSFYREKESEWVTHENWWGMDRALFNLCDINGKPQAIASVRYPDGERTIHCKGPFWHVCGSPDQRTIIGDTFQGELFLIDTALGESRLLTQGHRPAGQVHAHQSVSPDGRTVLFASGKLGDCNLMTIDIPLWSQLTESAGE